MNATLTFRETMAELRRFGTAQNVKIYRRHGAQGNLFGVSFANLEKLRKRIKTDHELALQLWESGNVDAQTLATMVADPAQMTEKMLDEWVEETKYYLLVDVLVSNIVRNSELAQKKLKKWTKSADEWVGRAGWQLLAHLAMKETTLSDSYLEKYLKVIEKNIHKSQNRTKDAMNSALIAIGIRNSKLERQALAVAKRIGKVEVDHGETNCKTPDAAAYILKVRNRKKEMRPS